MSRSQFSSQSYKELSSQGSLSRDSQESADSQFYILQKVVLQSASHLLISLQQPSRVSEQQEQQSSIFSNFPYCDHVDLHISVRNGKQQMQNPVKTPLSCAPGLREGLCVRGCLPARHEAQPSPQPFPLPASQECN